MHLSFTYFDGCPEIIVPDNPKPVTTKACPYEPDVNPSFNQMANHFDVAVIPARVRKPVIKLPWNRQYALLLAGYLAVLRKRTFFSLAEANQAVAKLLEKLNNHPFQKLPGAAAAATKKSINLLLNHCQPLSMNICMSKMHLFILLTIMLNMMAAGTALPINIAADVLKLELL